MPKTDKAKGSFKLADLSYDHQQAIEAMKSQLLIVLVNRLGGNVDIPAAEVDATGAFVMSMKMDAANRVFTFVVQRKADL
jgi:hypothetical protein